MVPGRDGYAYFFTSMAEGPMLSSMAMQQILVLLHVIHSFIPEECILETDFLKPVFDKSNGLEKLMESVPISEEEWQHLCNRKRQIARMQLRDIPRKFLFVFHFYFPVLLFSAKSLLLVVHALTLFVKFHFPFLFSSATFQCKKACYLFRMLSNSL